MIGALGFIALATASDRLESFSRRLIAIALVGAATLASVVIVAPHCIGDPLGELDPLLRDLWLSHNSEVQPVSALSKTTANGVIAVTVPVALGLFAALIGASKDRGVQQSRWLALACVIAIGFLLGLWKVRVFTSVTPLAMTPLAVAVVIVTRRLASSLTMAAARASVAILLCLAVSPMGLALAPVSDSSDKNGPETAANACQNSASSDAAYGAASLTDRRLNLYGRTYHGPHAALRIRRALPSRQSRQSPCSRRLSCAACGGGRNPSCCWRQSGAVVPE